MTFECRVNMSSSESELDYEKLKRDFCELLKNEKMLDMVLKDPDKPVIRDVVNSQRELDNVKCIEDLLEILERRNALSCQKPNLLVDVAACCFSLEATDVTSAEIQDRAFEAKSLVRQFMSDHGISIATLPKSSQRFVLNYKNVQLVNHSPDVEPTAPQGVIKDMEDVSLDECLCYLRSKFGVIGIRWPHFLRALPSINEHSIETFRIRKSSAEAFYNCLEHWKQNSPQSERNRATLVRAAIRCELQEIADGLMAC